VKTIELTKDLLTGIRDIDDQHREIFDWFNTLIKSADAPADHRDVKRALVFLTGYVGFHFAAEELAMDIFGYDGLDRHRQQHHYFRNLILDIRKKAGEVGLTEDLRGKLHRMLGEWLVHHIGTEDKALAAFLVRNDAEEPSLPTVDDLRSAGTEWLDPDHVEIKPIFDGELSQTELKIRLKNR